MDLALVIAGAAVIGLIVLWLLRRPGSRATQSDRSRHDEENDFSGIALRSDLASNPPGRGAAERIGDVKLARRTYEVYRRGNEFVVRSSGSRGQAFEETVARETVEWSRDHLRGKRVHADDAESLLERNRARLALPYDGGHKLHYYAQDILVILTALGEARLDRDGLHSSTTSDPERSESDTGAAREGDRARASWRTPSEGAVAAGRTHNPGVRPPGRGPRAPARSRPRARPVRRSSSVTTRSSSSTMRLELTSRKASTRLR